MPSETTDPKGRMKTLNAILTKKDEREILKKAVEDANGNFEEALKELDSKLPDASVNKVALAHSLAQWADDHISVVKALTNDPEVTSLRDVALRFNIEKLTALIDPKTVPEGTAGVTEEEKTKNFAASLQRKLFTRETTAVLHRMIRETEVPIVDTNIRHGLTSFLDNQPEFNIRTTSVYTAFRQPDAFKGIDEDHRAGVIENLKVLQRVQAISPVHDAVPVLMKNNLTSAMRVAELPESTFVNAHRETLGEETAKHVYTNAINTHIRNEQALMTIRETMRGSGLAIIDGDRSTEERLAELQDTTDKNAVPLNLETLFGSIDYCQCDECLSVYSPAAYFVDILQYLRNNNLGPNPLSPTLPNSNIHAGIAGTPLEKLFRRRPDLGCLELTCENTFTILPYIDLVNEVMESFIVHLDNYEADTNVPTKQATLDVFNIDDETTAELLAQPQHINYQAYCILKNAVYPFTLPYHQAIDAIRIWLKYLGTSRYELLKTFRTPDETGDHTALTTKQRRKLKTLHRMVNHRAVDAEFLGLTQEEYIILTREAFWPKSYFDLTLQHDHMEEEYRQKIGVRRVHEYYGYKGDTAELDMLSTDETKKIGLTFVKEKFLRRTGIEYVNLVDVLKTRFVNPAYPEGRALTMMQALRFSYRFLQTLLVDSTDRETRFAKLIEFLNTNQPLVPEMEAHLHPDPCHVNNTDTCVSPTDFRDWVYCYFDRIGQLIVLESGEGPELLVHGRLFTGAHVPVGTLHRDGSVVDEDGVNIGHVTTTMQVIGNDGRTLFDKFGGLRIEDAGGERVGFVDSRGLLDDAEQPVSWHPPRETCDLEKIRLTHLDGSPLTSDEYDRIQRFLRLWRKLGWSIDETDQALVGLSLKPGGAIESDPNIEQSNYGGFDSFKDNCADSREKGGCSENNGNGNLKCPEIPLAPPDISPDFLQQLSAIRKLLDLTGLPLNKLLTFWANISTAGEKSLYVRLFLTHNLLAIDKVFKPDINGNHLAQSEKISAHMAVLTAALRMKVDEIATVMKFGNMPDELTLTNVTILYRHSLLAKILHVRIEELPEVIALFGDPFENAQATLVLFKTWGKMEDAGFTFRQLNYVIRNHDDPQHQLAPAKRTILVIAKTLYDGLNAIDHEHRDLTPEEATVDAVRAKASLFYEQPVVDRILGLLEGTTVYTTNAPANG